MKEINYYLKTHMVSTIIAMILFSVQGLCIVALVSYVNNTVDIGFVRYGYEDISPEALLENSFKAKVDALKEEDKAFVNEHYTLLDKGKMTVEEYQNYEENYPIIASNGIYKKNWIGVEEVRQKLDEVFAVEVDEMLYEYLSLGMNPIYNQQTYIKNQVKRMIVSALVFALAFALANVIVASISAKIGYEERKKLLEGGKCGLRESLDLQDKIKFLARKFYAIILGGCVGILIVSYIKDYLQSPLVDEAQIVIWTISTLIFGISIFSALSIRGQLNKGIFLVLKVIVLGAITALLGSNIALMVILGYGVMIGLLIIIRRFIKTKLQTLLTAHFENIDNIDGQMTFVMNKESVAIEAVQMKKMVRSYLSNNEYLYRSSWMLELLENLDKVVVALFNFLGVIIVIAGFSYMYMTMSLPLIMMLPLILIYNF